MSLTHEKLLDIITEASYRLHREIKKSFKSGNLDGYLSSIGMLDILLPSEKDQNVYDTYPDGKILIFGDNKVKDHEIFGCFKEQGISKDRIELHLGYDEAKNFAFRKIQYNPNYRLVIFGPVPHSGKGKEDKSSIITQIETTDGYPKVIRLTDSHGLKLSKASLKKAISHEIMSGYLSL